MPWFEESDELAQAARFRDVTAPNHADLSWARPAAEPDEGSLRPPRMPQGLEGQLGDESPRELEDMVGRSRLPPPVEGLKTHDSGQHQLEVDPPPRRVDTMIDEIVPRAEEEAFVAIREAVAHAEATRDQQFAEAEERLVELAVHVARRVIARELSLDPHIVVGLVREGLTALGERDRVVVRVGTFFRDMREEIEQKLGGTKLRCEVVVDPSLSRSGCVVETDLGRVDESIDVRLENLLEALAASGNRKASR
jgi:vacuolar-type H+-ATPase subunit E/Vma4